MQMKKYTKWMQLYIQHLDPETDHLITPAALLVSPVWPLSLPFWLLTPQIGFVIFKYTHKLHSCHWLLLLNIIFVMLIHVVTVCSFLFLYFIYKYTIFMITYDGTLENSWAMYKKERVLPLGALTALPPRCWLSPYRKGEINTGQEFSGGFKAP